MLWNTRSRTTAKEDNWEEESPTGTEVQGRTIGKGSD